MSRSETLFMVGAGKMEIHISSNGGRITSSIQLRNVTGNDFRTSNSEVSHIIIEEMKRTLNSKVREVEGLIDLVK